MKNDSALIEIGTEELPPTSLTQLAQAFRDCIKDQLAQHQLSFTQLTPLYTPRRIALHIQALAERQSDYQVSRKGPSLQACYDSSGQLSKAAAGFLKSVGKGLEDQDYIKEQDGYLYFQEQVKGRTCLQLLPQMINEALKKLPIPKPMRWGSSTLQFIRPVHWVALLYGDKTLPDDNETILGCRPDRLTYGHRFHAPGAIHIQHPDTYVEQLKQACVLVDPYERRQRIYDQIKVLCHEHSAHTDLNDALIEEVTNLVEWPCAVAGQIERRFLKIPSEVLVTSMRGDQRYFPLYSTQDKTLLPYFITVANIESTNIETVRKGNERVIKPRFEDAEFFWNKDLQTPLANRIDGLKNLVFEKSLGSVLDKVQRVQSIAKALALETDVDAILTQRAALLCKCDLLSSMVYEFPQLQGIMGRYYAQHDKEDTAVAVAIEEHYLPIQSGDTIPASRIGKVLALSDRIDSIVGIFLAGKAPTGDKDPYGLRRAALGVIRIAIEGQLEFKLQALLHHALEVMPSNLHQQDLLCAAHEYIIERLRGYLLDLGTRADHFEAVRRTTPQSLIDFRQRVLALDHFRGLPAALHLSAAHKRIHNLISKTCLPPDFSFDEGLLSETAELELYAMLNRTAQAAQKPIDMRDYQSALTIMSELQQPIDQFFDQVLVMTDNVQTKYNRIALLDQIYHLFTCIADISALQLVNE